MRVIPTTAGSPVVASRYWSARAHLLRRRFPPPELESCTEGAHAAAARGWPAGRCPHFSTVEPSQASPPWIAQSAHTYDRRKLRGGGIDRRRTAVSASCSPPNYVMSSDLCVAFSQVT